MYHHPLVTFQATRRPKPFSHECLSKGKLLPFASVSQPCRSPSLQLRILLGDLSYTAEKRVPLCNAHQG